MLVQGRSRGGEIRHTECECRAGSVFVAKIRVDLVHIVDHLGTEEVALKLLVGPDKMTVGTEMLIADGQTPFAGRLVLEAIEGAVAVAHLLDGDAALRA